MIWVILLKVTAAVKGTMHVLIHHSKRHHILVKVTSHNNELNATSTTPTFHPVGIGQWTPTHQQVWLLA